MLATRVLSYYVHTDLQPVTQNQRMVPIQLPLPTFPSCAHSSQQSLLTFPPASRLITDRLWRHIQDLTLLDLLVFLSRYRLSFQAHLFKSAHTAGHPSFIGQVPCSIHTAKATTATILGEAKATLISSLQQRRSLRTQTRKCHHGIIQLCRALW